MTKKEIELVNELFELWDNLAQTGELSIGYGFNENYKRLKEQVLNLPVVGVTLKDKKETDFEKWVAKYGYKKINKLNYQKGIQTVGVNELRKIYDMSH